MQLLDSNGLDDAQHSKKQRIALIDKASSSPAPSREPICGHACHFLTVFLEMLISAASAM
jgi:hypothetical protein